MSQYKIPKEVEVFEIKGPLFFGAAYKFTESIKFIESPPRALIIRMQAVPIIDATGIHALEQMFKDTKLGHTVFIISGLQPEVFKEFEKSGFLEKVGYENIKPDFEEALVRARQIQS